MLESRYWDAYTAIFISDLLRYLIFAGGAFLVFWKVVRSRIAHRFIQRKFPAAHHQWREFRYSLSTVFIFSLNGFGIYLAEKTGLTCIYADISTFGWPYFAVSVALMLLFHDMYFYWSHRLMHHPKIYKRVHRVHHLSTNPSPWAAYAFHPWEALIQALAFTFMVFLLPLHPLALGIFVTHMIIRDVHGHLGFELFPKSFLQRPWLRWLTTTTHHNLHHKTFLSNYGLYFRWWDQWFETEHPQYEEIFAEVTRRRQHHE